MPARHCCFCLPLRLGAFVISLVQLVLIGLVAASYCITLGSMRGRLPTHLKGTTVANAILFSLISVTALIGLFGTIARNASLLATYAFYLAWFTGLSIVIGIANCIVFFTQSRADLIKNCIDSSSDHDVQQLCNDDFNSSKWSVVVSVLITVTIQLWAAYIVTSYADALKHEHSWRSGPGVAPPRNTSSSKYAHVEHQDHDHSAHVPLNDVSYSYPYNDTSNSFGSATHHHHTATPV